MTVDALHAAEIVLTVPSPEAVTREPDEVARVVGRRDQPLLVVVAAETLLDATGRVSRSIVLRIAAA